MIKMSNSEALGGLLGTALILGVGLWGLNKIDEALDSEKEKEETSFLDNTEPF